MRRSPSTTIFLLLVALLLALPALADNSTRAGDFTVHHNAVPTTSLTPDVARQYGITRSANRALLNVSVRRGEPGADVAVPAKVLAVATNLAGLPLATGRLIYLGQAPGAAKVGRMAVLRSSRGVGLGQLMLESLIGEARQRQISTLALHAQVSAQGFYARLGFIPEGPVFDEVGIPHQRMVLSL